MQGNQRTDIYPSTIAQLGVTLDAEFREDMIESGVLFTNGRFVEAVRARIGK